MFPPPLIRIFGFQPRGVQHRYPSEAACRSVSPFLLRERSNSILQRAVQFFVQRSVHTSFLCVCTVGPCHCIHESHEIDLQL